MSAASKGRSASAALTQRKKARRQWLAFVRMCRYGINNFSRNAWLTTAAMAIMIVTLTIISTSVIARNVFNDTINQQRSELDVRFFLKSDATEQQKNQLAEKIKQVPIVTAVEYLSAEQAREEFTRVNADNPAILEAVQQTEGITTFPPTLKIEINDPSQLNLLDDLFKTDEFKNLQNPEPALVPTTQGSKRGVIDTIATWAFWAERGGLALSLVSIIISILIIFNTIRMAIFTRRDEIQMMKLIGADKNFIQGPFIVEAIMYGVFAALITACLVFLGSLFINRQALAEYGIVADPTFSFLGSYPSLVLLVLIILGALIGVVSSFMAIRRYLKV